jgi:hypothetical protein
MLRWALPAAAAVLLILIYLPFRPQENGVAVKKGDTITLSQAISSELSAIDESLAETELDLISEGKTVDEEIETLMEEIETLETEV